MISNRKQIKASSRTSDGMRRAEGRSEQRLKLTTISHELQQQLLRLAGQVERVDVLLLSVLLLSNFILSALPLHDCAKMVQLLKTLHAPCQRLDLRVVDALTTKHAAFAYRPGRYRPVACLEWRVLKGVLRRLWAGMGGMLGDILRHFLADVPRPIWPSGILTLPALVTILDWILSRYARQVMRHVSNANAGCCLF